ncbi:hypothetical protein [Salsipaludibacter albus]|uniref:hypothetical protein n=1 Tax=Salsipaludibacter albus TaxID=2849650 RepID=UPI001EE4DA5E|nr:hypothetical protein [Salsipaludibacter albus]MBY5161468.1 hypothetical protein [Salsipaludibacter albus]
MVLLAVALGRWGNRQVRVQILDRPGRDFVIATVAVGTGLVLSWIFGLWAVVDEASRRTLMVQSATWLATVTGFLMAALSIARLVRSRSPHLRDERSMTKLTKTWVMSIGRALLGTGLVALSWVVDTSFGWGWLGWVAMWAVVFVALNVGRALWMFLRVMELSDR